MEDNPQNRLILALIGVGIGVTGIVAYYESAQGIFYTCTALSIMQWGLCMIAGALQYWSYPYLAACILTSYYITESFADFLPYGICLYYATALFYSGIIQYASLLLFRIVPIVSLVAFFMHYEHVFMVAATFCTMYFLITHFLSKTPLHAMDDFLLCVALGVALMNDNETDGLYTMKLIKGILWGGSACYILSIIHVFIHALINRN